MNLSKMRKSILAIAFANGKTTKAEAFYDGDAEVLTFVSIDEITGSAYEWIPRYKEIIKTKIKEGWIVMVEDRTASFMDIATLYNFDAVDSDGRTHMQNVLDWYFAFDSRGGIVFETGLERYAIRAGEMGLVEFKNDDKGRLQYDIDWMRFTAGHRAMLLCVAAAAMEEPFSEHWMNIFAGTVKRKIADNIVTSFNTITKVKDREIATKIANERQDFEKEKKMYKTSHEKVSEYDIDIEEISKDV